MIHRTLGTCVLLFALMTPGWATDIQREEELARDLGYRMGEGEMIWLNAQEVRFPALFRDSAMRERHGGIVLLHDLDTAPDVPELLHALRTRLPSRGWATLAVQIPLREAGAEAQAYLPLLPETLARIGAALVYLKERQIGEVILLGYRHGGLAVLRYLGGAPDSEVKAAILVNLRPLGNADYDARLLEDLGKVRIPLLDLLSGAAAPGEEDLIQERRRLTKSNGGYRLDRLTDTRTSLHELTEWVLNRIHGWLRRLPSTDETLPSQP